MLLGNNFVACRRFLWLGVHAQRSLFIHSEATPNPNSRKFIPEEDSTALSFFKNGSASPAFEWRLKDGKKDMELIYNTSGRNPPERLTALATELLQLDGVSRIFIGSNFLTATKNSRDWSYLSPEITSVLDTYFAISASSPDKDASAGNALESEKEIEEGDDEVANMVMELLDTKVRPYVQSDGGDIAFVSYSNGTVKVRLHGACSSCASSSETLKRGVAAMMKYYIPEVMDVIDVNAEPGGLEDASLKAFEVFENELNKKAH